MESIQEIKGRLTIEDVQRLNQELPKAIEILNIEEQDVEILSKLDSRISIKVDEKYFGKESSDNQSKENGLYSSEELCRMILEKKKQIKEGTEEREYIPRERPRVSIKSKELAGIFKNDEISSEIAQTIGKIKISVQDDKYETLKGDLDQIGKYYPELLRSVEIENTSSSRINMQSVIDEVYKAKSTVEDSIERETPIEITISSSFGEDFDLDFSNAPTVSTNSTTPIDGISRQKVTLKNLAGAPIRIPSLKGKISHNIKELAVDGFDLADLDISSSGIEKLTISSDMSQNISDIGGIAEVSAVEFEAISDTEFNNYLSRIFSASSDIHDLTLRKQNFQNRKILEELAVNPNLTRLTITRSRMNDIDGIELFDSRLGLLNLQANEMDLSDLERLTTFWNNNQNLEMYVNGNTYIRQEIQNAREISDESHSLMSNWLFLTGVVNKGENKSDTIDRLLWAMPNIPYYIQDAEIIRQDLKITRNPMMLKDDNEIDTIDFNESYLRDGNLLLTISQIERLLASGKVIPQNVRINIHDVSELSSERARELLQQMNAKGMNLSGVQIFDENIDNGFNQIRPYSLSEYVYIRDTLDLVVDGISQTEPDLDKFAVVYQRLMDSITYDRSAIKHDDATQSLYYAEKRDTSRNLLEGLEEGQCVCAGYSDILRNALSLVGIKARYNAGYCKRGDRETGHAWNQVELDDGTGNKKWYYTDLTWDAGSGNNDFTLLGSDNFINNRHEETKTKDIETIEIDDYDRALVNDAFTRAKARSFNFMNVKDIIIDIPEDPEMTVEVLDPDRIRQEYIRRKNDMYAKFYGNKDYQREYDERNARYRQHEIEVTDGGITYRTVDDYPEREADEEFLILDKYRESLERMTRYEAGDTSVYQGTDDQIRDALESDREYVETRNHAFDQHKYTQKDLATLGKYGERVPYIPRQTGVLRNIVRAVGNVGIFTRNAVSPIYRGIGKYVAQPLHRAIIRGKDASPYRNNWYHRMIARRDYYTDVNNSQNPGHPVRNAIRSRVEAVVKAREGNEAVLKAGAADIRDNIIEQETEQALIQNCSLRSANLDAQINLLEQELIAKPHASNIDAVREAIKLKSAERDKMNDWIERIRANGSGSIQTDAISDKQHAIASKEVNTLRVTAIKGVAKGLAVKYVGPKIHDWLLERGKVVKPMEVEVEVPETRQRWVEPTYKEEVVPIYEDVLDTSKNINDIMSANEGKSITGFYSVYGGEKGASIYELTGDEKITAIFQADGAGGVGLSDTVGLKAPVLTNETFASDLLDANGLLNQNITLDQLVEGLNAGSIDASSFENLYVSVGDRYWTKLSDLVGDLTKQVKVGEEINKVVDVAGHYEDYTEMVKKLISTTEVVTNPVMEKTATVGSKIGKGAVMIDGILDIVENLRKTTTEVKSNKRTSRRYEFDEEVDDIPRSRKEYKRQVEEER